jgi:hypothetical protein
MTRHWTDADFVVTSQTPAYDGSNAVNEYGYCRKCLCDMQRFGGNGEQGPLRHHSSHKRTRALRLWGRTPRVA